MSVKESSARYGVPNSTSHDKISTLRNVHEVKLFPKLDRFERTFSDAYGNKLVNHTMKKSLKQENGLIVT